MSRVVMVLQKVLGGMSQVSLKEPERPDADVPAALNGLDAAQLLQKINAQPLAPDAVKEVGTELLNFLALHPAIKEAVLPNLDVNINKETPIYLVFKDPELEKLPWEAIHAPNAGFVCGEKRWPFARARDSTSPKPDPGFLPPLRMMLIMGASGTENLTQIPADEEWRSIYEAVKKSQLNIRLRVLVCQEELEKEIAQEGKPWIETGMLTDSEQLFNDISEFSPHILHFFCHGVSGPSPSLQIASCKDWELWDPPSIQLEGSQLYDRAKVNGNTWLVTLNCCESAQLGQSPGSRSLPLASALVNAGFPAVVGMRERVETSLAHVFCRLFYDALLTDLEERLAAAEKEGSREVHWACGLYAARQRICEELAKGKDGGAKTFTEIAAGVKEWTIPIIYARLQRFNLRLIPDPDGTHPVSRPKPDGAVANTTTGGPASGLTLDRINSLLAERQEYVDTLEKLKHLNKDAKAFKMIEAQIAAIDKQLS
jgi:hypothetical protein